MKKFLKVAGVILIVLAIDLMIFGNASFSKSKEIEKINLEYSEDINYYSKELEDSILQIFAIKNDGEFLGSGFFIEDKIITCYHVVSGAKEIFVSLKDDLFVYKAVIANYDEKNDLAELRVLEKMPSYKSLNYSTSCNKNDLVYVCGFDLDYNIKAGRIDNIDYKYENNNYIKISTVVNRGNSGGPVLNENGDVIGVLAIGNGFSSSLVPIEKVINLINR